MTGWSDTIAGNAAVFTDALTESQRAMVRGRPAEGVVRAQMAAELAWFQHTGWFAHAGLEELLVDAGERVRDLPTARRPVLPRTVHVITQAYQTGGSTQFVASWLDQEPGRDHVLCLTRQGANPIPPKLVTRTRRDGAKLVRLDTRPGSLLARAAHLRSLARTADLVLLHTHPYDVVPVLALAGVDPAAGPRIVYVNHADHTFWIGSSVAHLVDNMRESGRSLSITRRGIDADRNLTVPRPLALTRRTLSRAEAREAFDVAPGQVLIATAADASKYRSDDGVDFLSLVEPVIKDRPDAVLVAAGPTPDDPAWARAGQRTGGRIRAVGRMASAAPLQQAADIYLDSFPFSSLTSLLEAGAFEVPIVAFRGGPGGCEVLGSDTPGIDEHLVAPRDPGALHQELSALIGDGARRADLGAATAEAIRQTHEGAGWRGQIRALYAAPARPASVPRPTWAADVVDQEVAALMLRTGAGRGLADVTAEQLSLLPARARLRAWREQALGGRPMPVRALLPEWSRPVLTPSGR